MTDDSASDAVQYAIELTIAWLSNAHSRASQDDVAAFLRTMHATVIELAAAGTPAAPSEAPAAAEEEYAPAVTVRKSLASKDHILSLIDGKPYKTLRRHLSAHGLTAEQYRERYKLKPDYPMVAENYSAERSATAKRIGLGRKPAAKATKTTRRAR